MTQKEEYQKTYQYTNFVCRPVSKRIKCLFVQIRKKKKPQQFPWNVLSHDYI